jgi:hypothetical protein
VNVRLAPAAALVAFVAVAVACGARSPLFGPPVSERDVDGGPPDAPDLDAPIALDAIATSDVAVMTADAPIEPLDAPVVSDVVEEPGACEDDQNTNYAPSDCGGPSNVWFAWPYTPTRDIHVQRIELHTTGAGVALLESTGGLPGKLLFQGTTPTSSAAAWLGVDLAPPVALRAGVLYYLAEQVTYCSQALGGTQFIEYYASTLAGPWGTTGTGSYTSHVIGQCP